MSTPAVSSAPPPRPEAPPLEMSVPDWHVVDTLVAGSEPPVLWPVGNAPLIAHWLDHAVRLGCRAVTIYCPDRPAAVRAALEEGAFWSLQVDLRPTPPPAGFAGELLDRLPGQAHPAGFTTPDTPGGLLRWWLDLHLAWLEHRDPATVQIDSLREPGGWIGPRAYVASGVTLRAPYWIGAGAHVGAGCTVGPHALVGPGSVLSADVSVERAVVLEGSFLGAHLDLRGKLLHGSTLYDAEKGVRVTLTDDFIASAIRRREVGVPLGERLDAACLWLVASVMALSAGPARRSEVTMPGGRRLALKTRDRGPLLARRASWLLEVARGRMRLVGILPRVALPPHLPSETRRLLEQCTPGVFSLADVHGCHDPSLPDEIAHALFQAAVPGANEDVRRSLASLLFVRPSP